jgi:lysine 2-monooxygenase
MAGLYFTWRILGQNSSTSITILEQLNRTGGRLDTDIQYINGQPVKNEEGGMRFTKGMTHLMWLLNALGRNDEIMPFGMGNDNNIYNLRGTKFTFGQANANPAIWSTIYNLAPNEKNLQPNEILQNVVQYILTQNGLNGFPETPGNWQQFRLQALYRGLPLYQWGFWALLKDYGLSQECLQMIEDAMGFLAFYKQEVNAGVGFQTMGDFDKLPQYLTLRPGYETLAGTLTNQINSWGGNIMLQTKVVYVEVQSDNTFHLVAGNVQTGDTMDCYCKQLVLALPSRPLQQLSWGPGLVGPTQFQADIQTVTSMPLTKINLYFNERWWYNRYQIANGGSFTDLPMAQFYCYDQISDEPTGPASMTIYCDYDRTGYWDTLQKIGVPFAPTAPWTQPPTSTPASTFVVEQAMRELATFFGDDNLPQPLLSTYVGWGSGGGYQPEDGDHSWAVGVRDDEVMARMVNPFPNMYVCGEAYSDDQAWVNGALRSTELVLQQGFDLAPPF